MQFDPFDFGLRVDGFEVSEYQLFQSRICESCGIVYRIGDTLRRNPSYFVSPHKYRLGCINHCIGCWLVGIEWRGEDYVNEYPPKYYPSIKPEDISAGSNMDFYEQYAAQMSGDILKAYRPMLDLGMHLAVMPVGRLQVAQPVRYPDWIMFYSKSMLDLSLLNVIPNRQETTSHAEFSSFLSRITIETLNNHALVVFPCPIDWDQFRQCDHQSHLNLIRKFSRAVDRLCFDYVTYRSASLWDTDSLPARVGQINSNHMMSGALIYNAQLQEARIIGGDAFPTYFTQGLGLSLRQHEWVDMPQDGEIGNIAKHAMSLYTTMLKIGDATTQFVQAMSLLEFLAYPTEYKNFKKVRTIVARYFAKERTTEYQRILDRFNTLTGAKNPVTGEIIGYRTLIVHIGASIEDILPDLHDQYALFNELDNYIRIILDHMIAYSTKSYDEYTEIRKTAFDG